MPSISIRPWYSSKALKVRMKVDFPEPEGPSLRPPLHRKADATQNMELVAVPLVDVFGNNYRFCLNCHPDLQYMVAMYHRINFFYCSFNPDRCLISALDVG